AGGRHMVKRSHKTSAAAVILVALASSACGGVDSGSISESESVAQPLPPPIDVRRTLVVTDQPILDRFPLSRVLDQLIAQSGQPGLSRLALFQQWWDTQNPGPGLGLGAHCDDTVDPELGSTLNGYPYLCRPAPSEGAQASCDPFTSPETSPCAYIPIGLFNRFDLAPEDGANCGEYRIVYAKRSGLASTTDRNLIIFEAVMPNPLPQAGVEGCRTIATTWNNLTDKNQIDKRADDLEKFYFEGSGAVPPVVSIEHYGDNAAGAGQVRTNQFALTTTGWSLREFKLLRSGGTKFVPVSDKNNAFGPLFDPASTHAQAAAFRSFFPSQVASLAGPTIASIDIGVDDVFNTGQSQASGVTAAEMRYLERLGPLPSALRTDIQTQLTLLGSALSPDSIALRAQANSCAGCHRLNNGIDIGGGLVWPASQGFTHVSERDTEVVGGVTRFRISDALINVFLPHRQQVFENYMNHGPNPGRGPHVPLGGRRSHG
ncbi:MAG: hypothetical protein ABW133_00930, partial [Polyangiaceae bacterium]